MDEERTQVLSLYKRAIERHERVSDELKKCMFNINMFNPST